MRSDTCDYHSRGSLTHKYLAVATPKVGCTTIKRALHAFEGLPPSDPWWAVHDEGVELRLASFSKRDQQTLLQSHDVLRFGFVRNPYDRMLSAWKSKFLRDDPSYYALAADIRVAYGYPDATIVGFGDFVRFVTEHEHPDAHWSRQVDILACDAIDYDVIGRFEAFGDDFAAILRRLDAPADVIALASEVTNPTPDLSSAAAYDTAIAGIVHDYYRADFDAFGYARGSWYSPR